MTGQLYNSIEDIVKAFKEKNLLRKTIVLEESYPTNRDFDALNEVYKLFCYAYYYSCDDLGLIDIKPMREFLSLNNYLKFRVGTQNYGGGTTLVVETNARDKNISGIVDAMVQKSQIMMSAYRRQHGENALELLSEKLAGTINRKQPLSFSALMGKWIASTYEDEDFFCDRPITYSLAFKGANTCVFDGAINCVYDESQNVIVTDDGRTALAYVISLDDDVLTVAIRYDCGLNGELIKRDILGVEFRRDFY